MRPTHSICLILFLFIGISFKMAWAGPGDTTVVQTFTFGSPQNAQFVFPPDSIRFEKILMNYTLKCNPNQNPACGEWDYTTHTYLYDYTGEYDSTQQFHPSFVANGLSPDTFMYMNSPSWEYHAWLESSITYDSVISFDSCLVGSGNISNAVPFNSTHTDARSKFIWQASELNAAGLSAGEITGIRLDVSSLGSMLEKLTVRFSHTSLSSLTETNHDNSGSQIVYSANTTFSSAGWNSLHFPYPFTWDGVSNILVEFSYTNNQGGTDTEVYSEDVGYNASVFSYGGEYCLEFSGSDFVDVPGNAFSSVSDAITISFWQYGNPQIQPQSDYCFEGYDSSGYRVLNSHLPWGNSRIYWDAGNDGSSFDRIDKEANFSDFAGKWNHWAFTKDLSIGQMRIYLNGTLWNLGASKTQDMSGVTQFRIGSNAPGTNSYDGFMDEFRVWNAALDENTIQSWMFKDIDPSHPNYSNLISYFSFNEGSGLTATDLSGNGYDASLFGVPHWRKIEGADLSRNFQTSSIRPNIIFEQGVYQFTLDSILITDSIQQSPVALILYEDTEDPTLATDTLYVWETYYTNYIYDAQGNAIDSQMVAPDSIIYVVQNEYYDVFEVTERYELGRFITPYGIGLDLGDGWTWVYDVTDYRTLLSDTVHLAAGNWQELLDMKFLMIEGIPNRDVVSIENLWTGNYYLSTIDSTVAPWGVQLDPSASMYKLKTRASGHHFDNSTNCAEFCYKIHSVDVEDSLIASWQIMQPCGMNPLYPQGGTWVYDRAGWCPGDKVTTQNVELTPYVNPGELVQIDYDSQTDPYGYYILQTQLVSYAEANFTNDAAVQEIISPNNWEIQNRFNPICNNPEIVIYNNGIASLTSVDIEFGVKGGPMQTHSWQGNLDFLESETVVLDSPDDCWYINENAESNVFVVQLRNPNGIADEYSPNDRMTSTFDIPPQYGNSIYLSLRTNNVPGETSYVLQDDQGNVVYQSGSLTANTTYNDTFNLSAGCYRLMINDSDCDGLAWWANNDGTGFARLYSADGSNTQLVSFEPDFGCQIAQSFTVGQPTYSLSINNASCGNADGSASLVISQPGASYTYIWSTGGISSSASNLFAGIYGVTVSDENGCSWEEKVVINDIGSPGGAIQTTAISCNTGCDGELTFTATGGTAPYSYIWNDPNNQTTATASGLCSGTYMVTVTGGNGCMAFGYATLTDPEELQVSVYVEPEISGCDGSARANASGGVAPYTYSWDGDTSSAGFMVTGLCAGDHSVLVTDANGCTVSANGNIAVDVGEASDNFHWNVFPNPASDKLHFNIAGSRGSYMELSVIGLLGKTDLEKTIPLHSGKAAGSIDISEFKPGIYFLRIQDGKQIEVKRFVVQ